jgi:DNA-binding FadR family transcriptional regulator
MQGTNGAARIQLARASQVVATELRAMILRGELGGDERLPPEAEFAAQLGISRHHLREALRLLEQDGLVRIRRGHSGGIFLTVPTGEGLSRTLEGILASRRTLLADLIVAGAELAADAAALAAVHATTEDVAGMEAILRQEDTNDWLALERQHRFHFAVVDAAHNETLSLLIHMIMSVLRDSVREIVGDAGTLVQDPGEMKPSLARAHHALLRAIAAGDGDRAAAIMRAHVKTLAAVMRDCGFDPDTRTVADLWQLPYRAAHARRPSHR